MGRRCEKFKGGGKVGSAKIRVWPSCLCAETEEVKYSKICARQARDDDVFVRGGKCEVRKMVCRPLIWAVYYLWSVSRLISTKDRHPR
jgi:hypothetical protein